MRKTNHKERVLARVLATELAKVQGNGDPVSGTVEASGRKDITDANHGDSIEF
jgi:hypothetical protein